MGDIDVIDPRYLALLERVNEVLSGDHRVRSVTVGGSVGAGTADQWSDLDLAIVTDPDHDEFIRDWPNWLERRSNAMPWRRCPPSVPIARTSPPSAWPSLT
jgi:hypothetical protein